MNENNTEPVVYAVGTRGYSAYEVAVQNGFVGTEQEWLDSLVGPEGKIGPEGKSAYQIAVENGYAGTEEEWVNDFLTPDGYYNKTEVDALIANQLKITDIIDNLQSDESNKVLSAKQGKVLNTRISNVETLANYNEITIASEIVNRENADKSLKQQIDGLASGSPYSAGTISDMTDTSKTYVLTTDGHWYYYDDSESDWVDGGVYQSAGIADASVTPEKTTFAINYQSKNKLNINNITPDCYLNVSGGYNNDNTVSVSDYIKIEIGDVIKFPLNGNTGIINQGGTYDNNKQNYIRLPQAELTNNDGIITYTATRSGYIRINLKNNVITSSMIVINEAYPITYEPYYNIYKLHNDFKLNDTEKNEVQNMLISIQSPLGNKKIGGCGDSIMESRLTGDAINGGAWIKIIGDEFDMTVNNKSMSGSTLSQYYNSGNLWKAKSIYWQLKEHQDSTQDYIIFDGGINDFALNNVLGYITNLYSADASNYDLDTILGGLEAICSELVFNHQDCKYGFLFNHRIYTDGTEKSNIGTYAYFKEQIIKVLNKWGIPYLDLESNIPPLNLTTLKNDYTCNGDGWHPNELGYRTYYVDKITKWLESL